jgi:hypothetical protein
MKWLRNILFYATNFGGAYFQPKIEEKYDPHIVILILISKIGSVFLDIFEIEVS